MKRAIGIGMLAVFFVLGMVFGSAFAADHAMGQMLRQTKVEGYGFMYHLLDKTQRNAMMKGMEGMEMPGMSSSPDVTNHLMVYITDAAGKPVSGTVGFMITGPDGNVQKSMTMGMHNGYGADVIFKAKGVYQIKTKAIVDGKTLMDDFTYEMK